MTRTPSVHDLVSSTRCLTCFRPANACFCDSIPTVSNRTRVVILQHRRERAHRFNTARIVRQSLQRCDLLCQHNVELSEQFDAHPLSDRAGLLYPSADAPILTELTSAQMPDQLVVVDGTWHHAKTLMCEVPRLGTLPCYRLAPTSPGRFRIRREPDPHALSTLEAVVSALRSIEPGTQGFDELLAAFDRMVDDQLANKKSNWRKNTRRRRGTPNVPHALAADLSSVVVAYGEQERGGREANNRSMVPVYWTAQRIVGGETFRCTIRNPCLHDQFFVDQLRLPTRSIDSATTIRDFCHRWNRFLRPEDQVVVYHPSTAKLLSKLEVAMKPPLTLKSIHLPNEPKHRKLEQFLQEKRIKTFPTDDTRAAERLANAVAYVQYLHANF